MDEFDVSVDSGSEFVNTDNDISVDSSIDTAPEFDEEITEDSDVPFDEQREIEELSDKEIETIQQEMDTEQSAFSMPEESDDFAKMIDSMSLDELRDEREKLIELGALEKGDLAVRDQSAERFDSIIEGLSKDQLETLRSKLESNDPEIRAILGLDSDAGDDTGPQLVLRRK